MTDSKHEDNTTLKSVGDSVERSDEATNLATIRDILFGEQVKEVEQKRQDLHQEFKHNLSALQKETRAQFEQISADVQTLYRLLNDETDQRMSNNGETNQRIDKLKESLEESNAKHFEAQDSLQLKVTSEAQRLEQQTRQWTDEISEKLALASKELKSDKTDRSDLAKMLRGVAEQLLDENKD